jgi:dinuclear metal center YbgI/SA1388 family protein
MIALEQVCQAMARIAPLRLAESWDNVGLLVGDRRQSVTRIMTCLTITPNVVDEAVGERAELVIAHHPLPFQPLTRINSDSIAGTMLLRLVGAGIAVYSAHTAFDSAAEGINQQWAELIGLESVEPLVERESIASEPAIEGSGRWGKLARPEPLDQLLARASAAVGAPAARRVGHADQRVVRVALACGSGGSFLAAAHRRGCDAMITGEASFHTCLEAQALGIGLGLLGHYWSERFALERLAEWLSREFPQLTVWPSSREHDPIATLS